MKVIISRNVDISPHGNTLQRILWEFPPHVIDTHLFEDDDLLHSLNASLKENEIQFTSYKSAIKELMQDER